MAESAKEQILRKGGKTYRYDETLEKWIEIGGPITKRQIKEARQRAEAEKEETSETEEKDKGPRYRLGGLFSFGSKDQESSGLEIRFAQDKDGNSLEATLPSRREKMVWIAKERKTVVNPFTGKKKRGWRSEQKREAKRAFQERKAVERAAAMAARAAKRAAAADAPPVEMAR